MAPPLVSIITPFKNVSAYIDDCLISIQQQTYTNWELLIVNDHSTDDSYKRVAQFAKNDARIQLYNTNGNGIIAALQLAYSNAKGMYITRMDADDIMHPEKLSRMVNQLQTHGKQHIALGLVHYFSDTGINDGYAKYERWLNTLTTSGKNFSEIYKECVIPSPCWMLHKVDFDACDAFNPNRYPEDYDLAFRCYKKQYRCIPSTTVLHYWRDYSTRTSRTHKHYAQNYFLDIKLHYFLKIDYQSMRPLAVWGAGFKGKAIAKVLIEKHINFYWVCNNPKKIGKHIYGKQLQSYKALKHMHTPQTIVTVANTNAQQHIVSVFKSLNMKPMVDYFFFC